MSWKNILRKEEWWDEPRRNPRHKPKEDYGIEEQIKILLEDLAKKHGILNRQTCLGVIRFLC